MSRNLRLGLLFAVGIGLLAYWFTTRDTAGRGPPADLSTYSLSFWPRNTLSKGQTVSTSTPHGLFTCTSMGSGKPRSCTLK